MRNLIYFYSMIFEKLLGDIDAGNVLDVGCGSGQFTEILVGKLRSFNTITGIDVDEESLSEAVEKFHNDKFRFLKAGSQELPFEDESFDLVVISKALHHVEDPEASLGEMKRVLRAGGYFMINEMHRDQLTDSQESHKLYHHLRSEIDNILGISHNQTFYREDLLKLSDGLGLRERTILEFSPPPDNAKDPENISEFIQKMDGWMHWLDGHSKRSSFEKRVEDLKSRFRKYGISRPPQLVILGKK
ncbi:class I SAM-dependent methyltransferase [Bacteroidota bacterium]